MESVRISKNLKEEMLTELRDHLLGRDFPQSSGLTAKKIRTLVDAIERRQLKSGMCPVTRRLSCAEIYDLCRAPLSLLCAEPPREGWMKFTYDYACHILYPDREFSREAERHTPGARFYLEVLQFFFDRERKVVPPERFFDFVFLDEEETEASELRDEYRRFLRSFRSEYVYEMMRLNEEVTSFRTLEHIAGVHYVAMHIARGLKAAGTPIDLALVSGAAAGHDLGKFGCKAGENVPYLHYYYTNQWFTSHRMEYIGHIAANHSTWDLEPDNLSVESLVLIYSDFRVKISRGENNESITVISSLKDAFDVILNKLENVDEKKLMRYRLVYRKLRDFEDYMIYQGVDVDLSGKQRRPRRMPQVTLRSGAETLRSLTFMAVEHNIEVMHRMAAERQFGNFLESARSEKDAKNLGAYLNIFDRYIAYTNDRQKKQTLSFLYELLMHREGDVSAEAARLFGKVVAQYNFGYRKRRPEGMPDTDERDVTALWRSYLEQIIHPDYRLTVVQMRRIRSRLKHVLLSVMEWASPDEKEIFLDELLKILRREDALNSLEHFAVLDALQSVRFEDLSGREVRRIGSYFRRMCMAQTDSYVRIAAWRAARILTEKAPEIPESRQICEKIVETDTGADITLTFLKYRILSNMGMDTAPQEKLLYEGDVVSDIFLDNLKTATPWVVKSVNIKLLVDQLQHGRMERRLHIASHLSNLVKVSDYVAVRQDAGDALVRVMQFLRMDERNDIVVELMRGLEIGEYNFSKYVPQYLGRTALWLSPEELDEIIDYIRSLMASPNDRVVSGAFDAISAILGNYGEYRERFGEPEKAYNDRRDLLFGSILRGLASYRENVQQDATIALESVFASTGLPAAAKGELMSVGAGKLLFLMSEEAHLAVTDFYRAAALLEIRRFMTEWQLSHRRIRIQERKKVAFFPGTFDPFTLSHKGIARMIRDREFEVYLAVDEFSWSKKVQPHLVRRRIVSMSIADEFHIHIFPDDIPINIANPSNLKHLQEIFAGREVYMVAGSDVIANASSYREKITPYSIHNMNHIAFRRAGSGAADSKENPEIFRRIRGEVVELELPHELEEISSTMIRENIDLNRDISNLIEPVVQEYIYNSSLYLREPEYKPLVSGKVISFEESESITERQLEEVSLVIGTEPEEKSRILENMRRSGDRALILRNMLDRDRLVGAIRMRYLSSNELFSILKNAELADEVRRNTSGEILLITGIYAGKDAQIGDPEQYLLSEALARSLQRGCSYAIYYPDDGYYTNASLSAIRRQGFVQAKDMRAHAPLYLVDMHAPLVLLQNMRTTIKEPLASNPRVLRVLAKAHEELQQTLTLLYPGQLVLSIAAAAIYPRLVEKITSLNGVPMEVTTPRRLGEYMCVPYGKILRDRVIPNTVTKTLHTDKVYTPDLSEGRIAAFQDYPDLEDQVRMIKAFDRPVILVDDLLHKGGRFEALEPLLKKEKIEIRKVILGMLSGYGRDTMAVRGVDVDCVYYIPNLRNWLVESTLYPFIGGDTVKRRSVKVAGLSPSINMILPYTKPFLHDTDAEALFAYSACCIRNARDIFLTLEEEFRAAFGKNLTLGRLSEAVIAPLCPDRGECVNYDPNLSASTYLENDLQMLYRTR
ncbi:MAG: cytidyltransferase-related domain protein [Lachnospiraceae bacterium]|nr:cytidyltransferase-related domain protein [Lachnospiraceae bacterium]